MYSIFKNQRYLLIYSTCIFSNLFLYERKGGSDAEGIFRLSGEGPKIKELRKAFNYQYPHHVSLDGADSLHNVANVLKVFLRELQDSLVPKMYYEDIKKLISKLISSFLLFD